ncbi:MAG: type II secretion system secretin GspD, partial [Deltaproteobacteria bacterium]|nr:type II secretion system secretin GspD [Deltaproteobacteria bacterium]
MFIRNLKFTGLALLICSLILVSPLTSAVHAANGDAAITLDFKDIELGDLIQTISALTGKNFVYDDSIRGKATIISSEKMTKDEAYQLFLTVMSIKGFTVVPTGKTHKIVATKLARQSNLPTQTTASNQDQFVTRMITLKHINAVDIASTILAPLMPKTSNIVVYQPSNMLIISDNASNIQRLATIIKELDVAGDLQETRIVALQYADAKETAKICNDLLATTPTKAAARSVSKNVSTSTTTKKSKVLAYVRTNRLVIMATAEDITTLEGVIAKLDQQPTKEHSRINLYYLENADAETLSKTLNEIITGIKKPNKKAATGAAIVAAALRANISVTADKPTNSLIVNATPEDYVVLKEIIRQLDIRRKQVYVEALIMELSMDATEALGVSLQGAFGVGDSGAVGISTLGGGASGISQDLLAQSVNGILAGGFSKLIDVTDKEGNVVSIPAFSALIDLSETDTNVNILSAPRLLTSDNEEAEIVVGRNVPIITSRLTDSTGGDSLAQSVSIERKDVALTLRFTPQITQGNLVRLNV